jgi:DNA transposition AAA+ family ATPase
MRSKIVPISNVGRLTEAADALINRAYGMPGMGLIEGHTGLGKTTAVAWLTTRINGVYVRALATTTPCSLLESICKELGIGRRPTNVGTVEEIVRKLAETNRPLFIDEADYLADRRRLIETLRDVHDLATVPVVLIGMHGFRRKITGFQQLTGRIAQWVDFQPSSIEDALMLAKELAEVGIGAELVRALHKAANGSVRNIVVGLQQIEQYARARSLDRIGGDQWPTGRDFFLGTAPKSAPKSAALAAVV